MGVRKMRVDNVVLRVLFYLHMVICRGGKHGIENSLVGHDSKGGHAAMTFFLICFLLLVVDSLQQSVPMVVLAIGRFR
jgi:hypothetical protein